MNPPIPCGRRVHVFVCFLLAVFAVSACNSINLWDEWRDIIQRNCTHEWSAWTTTKAPTCTATGTGTRACPATETVIPINPEAHDWEYDDSAIPPTCIREGSGQRECTLCPATEASGTYPALEHDWIDNWAEKIAPTCLVTGEDERECNRVGCRHSEARVAPALGHVPGNWSQTTPPTCTEYGIETGTCTRSGCTQANDPRNGATPLGHVPGNWSQTTPPTCVAEGEETGTCTRAGCSGTATRPVAISPLAHYLGAWYADISGMQRKDCQGVGCTHWIDSVTSLIPASGVTLTMRWMPAGTFAMGSPATEAGRQSDELQHSVTLTRGFYMGIYPVTQEQYQAVMGVNPSQFNSDPADGEVQTRRSVEQVSWYAAIVFCNRLSILEGRTPVYSIGGNTDPSTWGNVPTSSDATWNAVTVNWDANGYRLPTEAEWEYACRAGTTTAYYTGNTADAALQAAAWYDVNSGSRTREVGLKTPNAWGLYDMHGKVWEWCWDWFAASTYTSAARTDPLGPATGTDRVSRGGSWNNDAQYLRSARRNCGTPSDRSDVLGFRLVCLQ